MSDPVIENNPVKMHDIKELLESEFWADSSDDEGIGSDESIDLSDHYASVKSNESNRLNNRAKETTVHIVRNAPDSIIIRSKESLREKLGRRLFKSIKTKDTSDTSNVRQIETRKVFGVDLIEHLEQTSAVVPDVLNFCSEIIETHGVIDGVYRLSGQNRQIADLKKIFQDGRIPDKSLKHEVHSVASLLKVCKTSKKTFIHSIFFSFIFECSLILCLLLISMKSCLILSGYLKIFTLFTSRS